MQGVQWWIAVTAGRRFAWWTEVQQATLLYFDWEMITYWAIVGLSHALLYYRESRGRALRAAQLEIKLAESQLTRLQQQLHPHFLFNTLHAISALMHRDVEAADRMLMRLSDLLRMTLENLGQPEVSLQAELDFLEKYLQIEQTRFADRLTVRFDVQPEARDTRVPSLLLQPLVENAIKHGVAKKAGVGHIDISARRDGDKLLIEVRDDGVGAVRRRVDGTAEGHRRLDDSRAPPALVWRRLPIRVPSPQRRRRRGGCGAVANRTPPSRRRRRAPAPCGVG